MGFLDKLLNAEPEPEQASATLELVTPEPWRPDPDAPAAHNPELPAHQLARILEKLETYLDTQTDGIPGVEGEEQWPEFVHSAFTVGDTLYPIPGSRRRKSILLHNLGPDDVYVVPIGATDTSRGMPIPAGTEREIQTPGTIRLLCGAGGTAEVRTLEENA